MTNEESKKLRQQSNELWLQIRVDEWLKEYNLKDKQAVASYNWIDSHTLGICHFKWGTNPPGRCNIIYITDVFKDYPLASKAVLWHEFCHAEIWLKKGETDGHGDKWTGRLWRKPILALLDIVYAQLLFAIVKHKK